MIFSLHFEEIENTKTDVCAECKLEIIGKKYQMISRAGGPLALKVYEAYLCERCNSDTRLGVETGAETE